MPFRPGKISEASNNKYNSFNEYLNNYTQADLREKPESFIFNTGWSNIGPLPKVFFERLYSNYSSTPQTTQVRGNYLLGNRFRKGLANIM